MTSEGAIVCRIELFGRLRLLHGERVVDRFRSQRLALLLAYLALHARRPQPRERLIERFWPDMEREAGRNNLSTTLANLRQELDALGLPSAGVLEADRFSVGLRAEQVATDIAEFEQLLKRARSAPVVVERVKFLERASRLYTGDLLEDCQEEWAEAPRTAYRERYREALLDWAQDLETLQDWDGARRAAERATLVSPFEEEATLALMRVLARQGYAARAIETYRLFEKRLREELDAEPGQELRQLRERLQRDPDALYKPSVAPLAKTAVVSSSVSSALSPDVSLTTHSITDSATHSGAPLSAPVALARRGNLVPPLTSLVGREQERIEVRQLLTQARLLTLTGIGGCGKSRLAIQVGTEVREQYPDGVWIVELSALSDPDRLVTRIAEAMEIREEAGRSISQSLTANLAERRLLLILDNCEHLVGACAQLAILLLHHCPHLKILATSREPLALSGEQTYRVPCLSLPSLGQSVSLATLQKYSALRLFVERALQVRSDFALTEQNVPMVTQVCQSLDGIPLALELAAARVRVLSVEQIAGRLDDRFRLLTGGDRMALPRQQTLRALIDWSYELLTGREKLLLARLAVFTGGWTLEAAEAVVAGEGIEAWETLDLLTGLVDKSLVMTQVQESSTRYYLQETIRQYAQMLTAFQQNAEWLRQRHRDYFVALAEEADPYLDGPQQSTWFRRLEQERENMRATLKYCHFTADSVSVVAAMRLVAAIYWFWYTRGYVSEGRDSLEQALSLSEASTPPVDPTLTARVMTGAGTLARAQGDYVAARGFYERNLALARTIGDRHTVVRSLNNLGMVALDQQDYATAEAVYTESLPIARELEDKNFIAVALNNLGNYLFYQRGNYAQARALYAESLQIAREQGNRRRIALCTTNLALVAQRQDDYATARTLYAESIALFQELEDTPNTAYVLEMLAHLMTLQRQHRLAIHLSSVAESLYRATGTAIPPVDQQERDARLAEQRTLLGETAFATAWQEGQTRPLEEILTEALKNGLSGNKI